LWHLRVSGAHSALASDGRWYAVARWLALPTASAPLLGAPWTLRVFGIELLDPLVGLGVLVARAGSWTVVLGLIPTVLLTALLGRFFCSWLCPYALVRATSNAARALLSKLGLRPLDLPLPRRLGWGILALVLGVAALARTQIATLVYPPALISREVLHAVFLGGFSASALILAAAFAFDTFLARAGFCRYLCPGGALFSLLSAVSPLGIERRAPACTRCGACDRTCDFLQRPSAGQVSLACDRCGRCIDACAPKALGFSLRSPFPRGAPAATPGDRRLVLGTLPVIAGAVLWGRTTSASRRLRPPGAAPGAEFAARCIRCQRCAEVCPVKAIRFGPALDLRLSDTPFIDPHERACTLCMKCTRACPTQALLPSRAHLAEAQAQVRMGTPVLRRDQCIAWTRQGLCRLCYYACPYPDSAIVLMGPGQTPVFDPGHCVGCGQCEEVCPRHAHAIQIVPREES
jgi:NapH/MauN family ferredoxin-type protein/MauM/NapG family ferredoxin protein